MRVRGRARGQWRIQDRRSGVGRYRFIGGGLSGGSEFIENPLEKGDSGGSFPENFLNVGIYCGF